MKRQGYHRLGYCWLSGNSIALSSSTHTTSHISLTYTTNPHLYTFSLTTLYLYLYSLYIYTILHHRHIYFSISPHLVSYSSLSCTIPHFSMQPSTPCMQSRFSSFPACTNPHRSISILYLSFPLQFYLPFLFTPPPMLCSSVSSILFS